MNCIMIAAHAGTGITCIYICCPIRLHACNIRTEISSCDACTLSSYSVCELYQINVLFSWEKAMHETELSSSQSQVKDVHFH